MSPFSVLPILLSASYHPPPGHFSDRLLLQPTLNLPSELCVERRSHGNRSSSSCAQLVRRWSGMDNSSTDSCCRKLLCKKPQPRNYQLCQGSPKHHECPCDWANCDVDSCRSSLTLSAAGPSTSLVSLHQRSSPLTSPKSSPVYDCSVIIPVEWYGAIF